MKSFVSNLPIAGAGVENELFRTVLDSLQTGVYLTDRSGKILIWNQGAERIAGFKRHDVLGRPLNDNILAQCNHQGCVPCGGKCPFALTLQDGKAREARMQLRHKQGHPVPVLMRVAAFRNERNSITGVVASFDEQRIEADRDRQQRNLAAYGCVDNLTGIPNHGFTQFHLRENMAGYAEYHVPFGIVVVQVDRLQQFCSSYGHPAGDAILRVVSQTLRNSLRPGDFLGRWSESQFLGILPNCGTIGVEKACERIRKVAGYAGLQWWGDRLKVSTSIGFATVEFGDTVDSLLQRAQRSLEHAQLPLQPDPGGPRPEITS